MNTTTRRKQPVATTNTDSAMQAGREFIAAIDHRAIRTAGLISLDDDVAALAAAWASGGGPVITDGIDQAVAEYRRMWELAGNQWGGGCSNPGEIIMMSSRNGIVAAVNAAVAEYERAQVPAGEITAAEHRVAELEAKLSAAVDALDAAVRSGDLPEALRLRGPARVEIPQALAAARLQLLDAQLEQRRRGREVSRVRVERAGDAVKAAEEAIVAAELQLRTAVETARVTRLQAGEVGALDDCHVAPIEALQAERERLVVAQAGEQSRRQHELAALTS